MTLQQVNEEWRLTHGIPHPSNKHPRIDLGHPSTWQKPRGAPFHDYPSMVNFLKARRKNNDDAMVLMDGEEGSGKSTDAFTLCRDLDPTWNPDTGLVINYDDWQQVYDHERGRVFLLDEGGNLMFSRNSMGRENKELVQIFMESRIFNHTLVVLCPNIHWVDKYVREHRAKIYGQVTKGYTNQGTIRGHCEWKWRHRWFDNAAMEWKSRWRYVYDQYFDAVPASLPMWKAYERLKMAKIQERQFKNR